MSENSLGQVEVLTIDDVRYVIGKSLAKVMGISPDSYEGWIHRQIKTLELVNKKDYIKRDDEGFLFLFEPAALIFEKNRKMEKAPRGRRRKSPYPLDEYGLPILPKQKRQGPFINPFAWARDEPRSRPLDKRAALIGLLEDASQSRPRRCRYPTQKPAWMELLELIRAEPEE